MPLGKSAGPPGGLGLPAVATTRLSSPPLPAAQPCAQGHRVPKGEPRRLTTASSAPRQCEEARGVSAPSPRRPLPGGAPGTRGLERPDWSLPLRPPQIPTRGPRLAAGRSARRRVRHKQTGFGRTWTEGLLRPRHTSRARGAASQPKRREPPPAPPAPRRSRALHGSAAAALQPGGASRSRLPKPAPGLNLAGQLHSLPGKSGRAPGRAQRTWQPSRGELEKAAPRAAVRGAPESPGFSGRPRRRLGVPHWSDAPARARGPGTPFPISGRHLRV